MSQSGPPKERNTVISVLGEIIDFKITRAETAGALCVVELTSFPHHGGTRLVDFCSPGR
jgi:hypothetical protein